MKKILSIVMPALLFVIIMTMAVNTRPVRAQPYVRVYVNQGNIPGVPVGTKIWVDIIIEVSGIADNTLEGIIGWRMNVAVDPAVLGIYSPPQYTGAAYGYFLYNFAYDHGYSQPTLLKGTVDPSGGNWNDLQENILPPPPGGAGGGYSGRKLVTIALYSRSETAYSRIDLMDVEYVDTTGTSYPVDEVIDGYYNQPELPEFPSGIGLLMTIAPITAIVYIWRLRKKNK